LGGVRVSIDGAVEGIICCVMLPNIATLNTIQHVHHTLIPMKPATTRGILSIERLRGGATHTTILVLLFLLFLLLLLLLY
jgi:hypothetical protein